MIKRNFPHPVFGCKVIPVTLSKTQPRKLITILSYRVPVENYVLEFPAGANDSGDAEECCLRELKARFYWLHHRAVGGNRVRRQDYERVWDTGAGRTDGPVEG